jgi:cbb3-type cytochrome oxidase maturation protein
MSVILIMIPGAMVLAALGVWAFINAAKRGQFDDLDTPAIRAVFDDDDQPMAQRKSPSEMPGDPK